jgi:hypothetical protein
MAAWGRAGAPHHRRQDVRIEHALHRNAIGGGLKPGNAADRHDQRLAVVRPRAADQRAIDIEKDESLVGHPSPQRVAPA